MKRFFRFFAFVIFLALIFGNSFAPVIAQADSLVVKGDGAVVLIIGDDDVLGISLAAAPSTKTKLEAPSNPAAPHPPQAPATAKPSNEVKQILPITPPNTPSVIQTTLSPTNNTKLQVTVNNKQAPVPNAPNSSQLPSLANPPAKPTGTITINKEVNRVILEGKSNQPILTITPGPNSPNQRPNIQTNPQPSQNSQMMIQQGLTQVNTSLPLQIDTGSHAVSAVLSERTVKLNVLPREAVQGAIDQKLITGVDSTATKVSLEEDNKQPIYKIQGERSGKLLDLFPVNSPAEVKLSAQTGNVIGINQSLVFTLFDLFIR